MKNKYKVTLDEVKSCLYLNFIYHPSDFMYKSNESSECTKQSIKVALKNKWIKLDKKLSSDIYSYILTELGYNNIIDYI